MKTKSNTPLVSICCITYNHRKFISSAIEGFLMQKTDFETEIVIGDDCSTDGNQEILLNYERNYPEKFRLILRESNIGPQRNFADAIGHCSGKYIALCEGDDYWADPYKLKKQVDFLENNPGYVICYHDAIIVDEFGNLIQNSKLQDFLKKDFSQDELIQGKMILTLSMCFRNVLRNFPEEFFQVLNGDKFLTSLLGHFGRGKYLSDIKPGVYRRHKNSIWSSHGKARQIFENGKTRAWLARYYSRQGNLFWADYFKKESLLHFQKALTTAINSSQKLSAPLWEIFTDYDDLLEKKEKDELLNMIPAQMLDCDLPKTLGKIKRQYQDRTIVRCFEKEYYRQRDLLTIDWIVTRRCNYRCSYCTVHDNTHGFFPPLQVLKRTVDEIARLPNSAIRILLAGGEPTIHPYFIDFIEYLAKTIGLRSHIVTQTNLGLPLSFYQKWIKRLNPYKSQLTINASYHFDHAEEEKFLNNVLCLTESGFSVNIMMCAHPLFMEDVRRIYHKFSSMSSEGLKTELVVVRENFGSVPDRRYRKEDLLWLQEVYARQEEKKVLLDFWEEKSGQVKRILFTPNEVIALGLNRYRGMRCFAGLNMISINANGDLDPAVCFRKIKGKKPNIYENPAALNQIPHSVICPFEACGVPIDIMLFKTREDLVSDTQKARCLDTIQDEEQSNSCQGSIMIKEDLNVMKLKEALSSKGWNHKENLYIPCFDYVINLREIDKPNISIIVISWRLHPDTLRNFQILERQRNQYFELIFVDNGGKPGEFDCLKPYIDTYVRLKTNTGAYLARNVGAVFAKAPILLFLEDDGLPQENFIEAHLDIHKKYDVIAVRGVYKHKTPNPLNKYASHYYLGDKPFPYPSNLEGNSSYRADIFYRVGGWDDEIVFGYGGRDLAVRLLKEEKDPRKQIYAPQPVIYHDFATDESHLKNKVEKQQNSLRRLKKKHPDWDQLISMWDGFFMRSDALLPQNGQGALFHKDKGHGNPLLEVLLLYEQGNMNEAQRALLEFIKEAKESLRCG